MTPLYGLFRMLREDTDRPSDIFAHLPVIQTERLILRPVRMSDAEDMFAYSADPQVARYVLWDAHRSVADTKGYLRYLMRQYRDGAPSTYAIVERQSDRMIGTIGFMSFDEEIHAAEVGYSLGRAWWGQGLIAEALTGLLPLCFGDMALNRVEALHEVDNPASGRVLEKCGFVREGVLRQRVKNKGALRDVVMWSLLRRDWLAARDRAKKARD